MTARTRTLLVLIAITLAIVAWDIWLYVTSPEGDTVSRVVADLAQRHPMLPFGLGVVCGHWLWPLRPREETR